jgi:hypothetical protein
MVTPQEIAAQLMRIERARNAGDAAVQDEDDPVPQRPGLEGGTCSDQGPVDRSSSWYLVIHPSARMLIDSAHSTCLTIPSAIPPPLRVAQFLSEQDHHPVSSTPHAQLNGWIILIANGARDLTRRCMFALA